MQVFCHFVQIKQKFIMSEGTPIISSHSNIFHFPEINSKSYKEVSMQLIKLISDLDSFTDDLQEKVDGLLENQQLQFKKAYSQHMYKIKEQFDRKNKQLISYQQKIDYYENQGRLSILLKRVSELEGQTKKLFQKLDEKTAKIKKLQQDVFIYKNEIRGLEERIKDHIKNRIIPQKVSQNLNPQRSLFATEVSQKQDRINKMLSEERSSLKFESIQKSDQLKGYENNKLIKKIAQLKKQNHQLILLNSKFLQKTNNMQDFFFDVVNELKRNVTIRKKVRQCSLQDFKKEDKMQLLMRILCNDQILAHIHQKLFGKSNNHLQLAEQKPSNALKRDSLPLINQKRQHL